MTPAIEMIAPADVQAIADAQRAAAAGYVTEARLAVTDLRTLQRAIEIRQEIGRRQKTITEKLAGPKGWAYKLHQWFCELERAALAPLVDLDRYEQQEIGTFTAAESERRRQQERDESARQRREEQDHAAAEAAALEHAGEPAMAAAVVEASIRALPPVVVRPTVQQEATGLKTRRNYLWRFVGDDAVRAKQLLPREYLAVDEGKLSAYAKAMKGTGVVPGIEFYHVDVPVR